jgi:hypothetical protein
MFGHERSLVQRFAGQPFVLLGVNADPSPERLRQIEEKAQLTWASWWDGPEGPICATWGADRFPAFFLIDHQGVVRWHHFGAPPSGELETKIDKLVDEARKAAAE